MDILQNLIEEDFGIKDSGTRWAKSIDHSSLVLDKDRGIFYYNSLGIVGDAFTYLTKIRGLDFQSAKDYLKKFDCESTLIYTIKGKKEDVVVFPKLVDIFFEDGLNKREYFYNRGLTDTSINRFQLGYWNGWSTVPLIMNGTLKNFQLRKDNPKTIKSYYKGVGSVLFNSDYLKLTDEIFLTEGPIDAIIMVQNGLPAISTNSGGVILSEWYMKFVNQKRINVVFDNDSAGNSEAKRVAKQLGVDRCYIYNFWDFEEQGYDPVNFFMENNTSDDLVQLVKEKGKRIYEI